ncbi:hypothetical protein L226DRAFT_467652 [Lentinus tigrinus ALCF2SS1-7]|uniref:Queuosine 5'-phosphate N-glycosylase/hydrolase n=1 Tax=Lentinus tigrinus ALCF2SS1-6 TaxID=1328759 RepID=A0A5C2S1P7_9APHY|nr:hypothetical protein L227DRAFT_506999 [Lentinus tigrinus ALCF2SS1-6]RPD72116.1 hypothetical protein L226DRAFT_467652 [Lentinus tigrinus ALCF2SS1-7]
MTVTITTKPHEKPQTNGDVKRDHAAQVDGAQIRPTYDEGVNPVLETSKWAVEAIGLARPNEDGIRSAAKYIHAQMQRESYAPRTWRTHPLHICPAEPFSWKDPSTHACLNWIFLISSLNFSFWSELEGQHGRYGVEWREGWDSDRMVVHTGYWSLVAAIDRALEDGIPITDPAFYASETRCPDSLIEHVFRPAAQSTEGIPLLHERVRVLREVGVILCSDFGGSFCGFIEAFRRRYEDRGSALQLVKMVADTFPSFRDEHMYDRRRVYIWKRTQILVAEAWAAFYPEHASHPHPLFPAGARIHELTMFADYRVPQILHHLRILSYPPSLVKLLNTRTPLASGSPEELSIRAASIVAVERVRREILRIVADARRSGVDGGGEEDVDEAEDAVSSVVIDFYLWDLAKRVEGRPDGVEGIESAGMLPIHRTRSIWY